MMIGYAVDCGYSMESQFNKLKRHGAEVIVTENQADRLKVRTSLLQAINRLVQGDILIVCELALIGRSLNEMVGILNRIHGKGAALRCTDYPIDTAHKLVSCLAENMGSYEERHEKLFPLSNDKGGRPSVPDGILVRIYDMWDSGRYTRAQIAKSVQVSYSTVCKYIKSRENAA